MRTVFVLCTAALLVAAAPAVAQTLPHLTVEDIGTPVDMSNCTFYPGSIALSPDGQWLAYNKWMFTYEGLWGLHIKPVAGGDERFVYLSQELIPEEILNYHPLEPVVPSWVTGPECNRITWVTFTPDSREITFGVFIYDESRGSEIIITYRDDGTVEYFSRSKPVPLIKSINIETGEIRDIATGMFPQWDPSGRYLLYLNWDYRVNVNELEAENHDVLMVLDTLSGESWVIDDEGSPNWVFTPEGKHILFKKQTGDSQLVSQQVFRVPIGGGEAEQLTFITDEHNSYVKHFVISPDGKWLFFQKMTEYRSQYTHTLSVLELDTGKIYDVIPFTENLTVAPLGIAPDGRTLYVWVDEYSLHIHGKCNMSVVAMDFDPENPGEPLITAVEDAPSAAFPTIASYPNPFNPTTTISFTLPEARFTELAVYNLVGQRIRTLVAGELSAGVHEVVWDGRDDSGNPVSSGIFVSRLVTGDTVVTNRMTLVK